MRAPERCRLRAGSFTTGISLGALALALCVAGVAESHSEGGGVVVSFADPALDTAVRAAILKPAGAILNTDLVGVGFVSLAVHDAEITDLSGLEYCLDLREISLRNNLIADLSPLSVLTNLILLDLNNNQASDLSPISALSNLITLRLKGNGISTLPPLDALISLEVLTAGQNELSDLTPLRDLPALEAAGLADNLITNIEPLRENFSVGHGDTVDLSGNPLGDAALCLDIPTLQDRGVDVAFTGACTGEGQAVLHAADQDGDNLIGFRELLRVVQLYNSGEYACDPPGEDGFTPGPGDRSCAPHAGDYAPQDWSISLGELLRLIQIFNAGGYHACASGEDMFCAGKRKTPPNVVFVVVDTLKADRIQALRNGLPVAPFLSAFASQGAHFTNAQAPSSWTRPSMFGFFTGMYPNPELTDNGETIELFSVPPGLTSLGEWFAGYGYDCWAVQTNGNASAGLGFAQGFKAGRFEFLNEYPAALITDRLLENMPEWKEPFFSFVQYIDPHGPYAPPVEYQEVFGPQPELQTTDEMNLSVTGFRPYVQKLFGAWVNETPPAPPVLSENGKAAMLYRYDAEIRYLDDELARLIDSIEEAYPNTIFVVLSDHGEALEDREALIGHGHTLYDEQTNVPLLIKGPGIEPQLISTRVEALGVLPTLANALGFKQLPQWQSPDCFDQATTPGAVFGRSLTFFENTPVFGDCVTVNGLKYIDHSTFGMPRLYDLTTDPGETANMTESQPGTVTFLKGLLDMHRNAVAQTGG